MLFVRSAAKLYTLLLVFLLPIQLVVYIQFGTIKIGCRRIILGSGFGNSETDMLHLYLHSTVSQHITLQGITGSRNLSSLTDPEISHLHEYLLPDWGHTGVVVGDVSVCNIKYAEYLLRRCNNVRVIIVSDGWEKDFHSMRKWMLSLNEDPWSVNNTSSHPICFPQLNSEDIDSLSFNNLVRRLNKNYRTIVEKIKVNYKSQVFEITTDVLLNAPHNVTKLLGMKQKGPTTWVYRDSGRHSNADRTAAVLHAPHGTPHRLTSLTRLVRQSASLLQPEGNCPDDLLFVFVDNLDSMPLLKRSLVKKGCRFVHLGQKLIGWTWAFKIEAVLWFLQRSKVTNDTYIISSDAGDSALVSIMVSCFLLVFSPFSGHNFYQFIWKMHSVL